MRILLAHLAALIAFFLVVGCAHSPSSPQVDRTLRYQPTDFERQVGLPPCKVSVPLTQDEALLAAERSGAHNFGESSDWSELMALMESGDQLRYVWCIPKGRGGVVFFALYRGLNVVAKAHTVMLD